MCATGDNNRTGNVVDSTGDTACLSKRPVFIRKPGDGNPLKCIDPFTDQDTLRVQFYVQGAGVRDKTAKFSELFLVVRYRHIISAFPTPEITLPVST